MYVSQEWWWLKNSHFFMLKDAQSLKGIKPYLMVEKNILINFTIKKKEAKNEEKK